MTLPHAIYGSATGLGDFGILASTAGLDERVRSAIVFYSSLEGSARSTPFAPIFSFYATGGGLWVFSRTLCLGPTRRGNDYLVHAIVLDAEALAHIDYRPFALAPLFVSTKPAEGSTLKPLNGAAAASAAGPVPEAGTAPLAACLRALARGPLRLRIDDDARAADICRDIHESLPPDDRVATTFCTRFSYGRNLGFRLAAFAAADETRVRETAPEATVLEFPPPATAPDLFDRWTSEMRGRPELDLVGLSVLADAGEALALVESVRTVPDEKAAALILRKENRDRAVVQSVLPGALAVDLAARVRSGTAFDECARLCGELDPQVRRAAVQWLRKLKTTPAELWMAEVLLLLEDAPLSELATALQRMQPGNPAIFRAFATTLLGRLRERFGAEGATVAANAARQLKGDALLAYVRVMEETRDPAWLMAIVRDVFAHGGIAAAIPARIVLTNNLLDSIDDAELQTFAPAFFVMEEKLANVLATTQRPALYLALVNVAQEQLCSGWTPATANAAEVLRRVLLGGIDANAPSASLTIITFLGATVMPAQDVLSAIEYLAARGVTPTQAALLLRTLQTLGRRGVARAARVDRQRIRMLLAAARPPAKNVWNRLGWYLRMQTLTEIAG